MSMPDLLAAMPERTTLSPEFQQSVAVHEAAHALVGVLIGRLPLVALSIEETFLAEGGRRTLGGAHFDVEPVSRRTRSNYFDRIAMLMGGIAAEEIVYGSFSDGAGGNESSDLHSATNLATQLECQLGMGRSLVSEAGDSDVRLEEIRVRNPILWNRIDAILREQHSRAKQLIADNEPALHRVVAELLSRKFLSGDEVVGLIDTGRGQKSPAAG
ncbi:hypothetical protein [Rhizobium tubonense]|nr:hypothetical protein [Rhizobium tubonense]